MECFSLPQTTTRLVLHSVQYQCTRCGEGEEWRENETSERREKRREQKSASRPVGIVRDPWTVAARQLGRTDKPSSLSTLPTTPVVTTPNQSHSLTANYSSSYQHPITRPLLQLLIAGPWPLDCHSTLIR